MTAGASTGQPSSIERASGAIIAGVAGLFLGSVASIIPAIGAFGWWPTVIGGVAGLVYGALRPPGMSRLPFKLPEAVPGEPAPIGALGAATVRDLEGPTAAALLIGTAIGIAAIPIGWTIYAVTGTRPSLTVLGLVGVAGFLAALVCAAFLPALLVPARRRAALVTHTWLGAREFRRAFGSRDAAQGFPITPDEVPAWIASHPETDAIREALVEVHLMARDFVAAREAVDRMPASTPREQFAVAMLSAMVDYQEGLPVDDHALHEALEAVPEGLDAVEAAVAVATLDARRALPDGDWREPLVRARPLIPEGDLPILVRDFGAVNLRIILRKTWPVLALLVALTFILGPMVDAGGT